MSGQIADETDVKILTDIFKSALGKDKLDVKVEYFKDPKISAILTLSEQLKRYMEMSKIYGGISFETESEDYNIVINRNNSFVEKIIDMRNNEQKDKLTMLCQHIYDICRLSNREFNKNEKNCLWREVICFSI